MDVVKGFVKHRSVGMSVVKTNEKMLEEEKWSEGKSQDDQSMTKVSLLGCQGLGEGESHFHQTQVTRVP